MRAQEPSPQVVGQEPARVTWTADGPTQFAGAMMVVAGIWHGLIGLAGLAHDTLLVPVEGYVYAVDLSAWGWAHVFLGVALAALGVAVHRGLPWSRLTGFLVVGVSLLVNFLFIPYHPAWSVLVIALDVAIVLALAMGRPRTT